MHINFLEACLIGLLVCCLASSGCSKKKDRRTGHTTVTTSSDGPADDFQTSERDGASTESASIGMRTFNQVFATMLSLTGLNNTATVTIPVRTSNGTSNASVTLQSLYERLNPQMPENSDLQSFNGTAQKSIFTLAISFCDALVNKAKTNSDTAQIYFAGVDFNATPKVALSDAFKKPLTLALISAFASPLVSEQPDANMLDDFVSTIDQLVVSKPSTVQSTSDIVTVVCGVALSSFGSMSY